MKRLRNALRIAAATGIVATAVTLAEAPAQAGSSCSGHVCVSAWDEGAYYSYQVMFQRNGWPDGYVYGHADVSGPGGMRATVPASGNMNFWSGVWSAKQWSADRGSGQVCARLWAYQGGSNWRDMGTTCTQLNTR